MPLYDYACSKCGRVREVRHGFDETYDGACEACAGPLRRVFNPAPVLFKGSGFYVTDSRGSRAAQKAEAPKEAGPESKTEASPAKPAKGDSKATEPAA
jgi:putative FmdB family regulatory protein